ncbi:hypothetical protein N7G274_009708 [Stereocaulon virgatum]|uniref:DUF6594 domain-containing protein n=1 Tax=Stereocaulon virgatum TaxID=373712 RepID=A0ABR3ZVF3_9LECA
MMPDCPYTPASTAPTSPTVSTSPESPRSTAPLAGDCVVNVSVNADNKNDDEQGGELNEKSRAADVASESVGFAHRVWSVPQHFIISKLALHVRTRHRSEDGRPKLVQRIDDHPRGYPKLAAFVNSDENFLVCRKYGFLRSRVLLYRQDELSKLEKTLIELDELDSEESDATRLALMSRKTDEAREEDPRYSRKTLINKIDDKLKEYDDLVNRIRIYVTLKTPSSRNWNSFAAWMKNEKPLTYEERSFMEHKDDVVALSEERECGWLDGVVEDTLTWFLPRRFTEVLLKSKEQRLITDDRYTQLISKRRTDIVVRLVLTLVIVALIVGPSAVLFFVAGHAPFKIIMVLIFTLFFSLAVGAFTKAKRHEMLAATATYAAVLVVFLGNFSPNVPA